MPRPGKPAEKSKDFFGSMKQLLKNLKSWKIIMIMALILAMASAILSLITPNKLSDFTDIITEGIKPNTVKLEELSNKILTNLSSENINKKIPSILINDKIKEEDKLILTEVLKNISNSNNQEEIMKLILTLPDSILSELLNDIKIDNVTININDQLSFIKIIMLQIYKKKFSKTKELI